METDTIDNEAKVQDKYDQEQKKQAEEQEQKEAEKSEHDDKYYVVHGATCVCNKAEDPTKEAKIVVNSHKKLVINDSDGKFAVTEEDKTMDPPAATYGKCTLKPSSSGNMPCAPAFGPKWDKTYDKKVVSGKTVVTEISTLQCTVGGVVTIKKHGQTNSVVKEHAENTDPAEQMLINPAVQKPVLEQVFPVVDSISLKNITGRTDFIEMSSAKSKEVEKITIRKNEECIFAAKLKSGNSQLTSWVIYEGDKKSFVREQTGTQFQNAFLALGTYRVEGYGKPKSPDYNNGANDKNYTDCSIDVQVVVNKLDGSALETKDGDTFSRQDKTKTNRLRQNFPAVFEAKFLLSPNEEELQRVKIFAKDEAGNTLTDGKQNGNSYTFTPTNTTAQYTITAEYTSEDGTVQTQMFSGKTESLSVLSITNAAEVIRPETAMKFSVGTTQYKTSNNITSEEGNQIKWNLNGKLVGTGSSINLPGSNFLKLGTYVVEAYVSKSNAFGSGSKDEEDDWRFSVKHNDVVSFTQSTQPKVGKKFTLKADKFVMPPNEDEKVVWDLIGKQLAANAIEVRVVTAGKQTVSCRINRQLGVKQTIDVRQAELIDVVFTDKNGVKMQKTSWGRKANIYITQKELQDEDFKVQIIDDSNEKVVYETAIKKYDGALIPIAFDEKIKANAGDHTKFHVKIDAPELVVKNEEVKFPKAGSFIITNERKVFDALLGEENASKKHTVVDYDKISWFYAHTTGIPANEEVIVEVWESVLGFDTDMKYTTKAKVDESGVLKCQIKWSKIPKIKKIRVVYIQVKDKKGETLYDADGKLNEATVNLLFTPTAVKMVENKSAVVVGTSPVVKSGICVCKQYDLIWGNKVSCEFRKKVVQIAQNIGLPTKDYEGANWLMAVMALETAKTFSPTIGTFKKHKDDTKNGYVGLIQIGKDAAIDLGVKRSELIKLTAEQQLVYVEKFLIKNKNKFKTKTHLYLAINYPNSFTHADDPNYVVYDSSKAAYDDNPSFKKEAHESYIDEKGVKRFHKGKKGSSYVWEFEEEITNVYNEGKNHKAAIKRCIATLALNAKDVVTFRIYADGVIEKHVPKVIGEAFKEKYKYIYHDKANKEHVLGTFDYFKTVEMNKGNHAGKEDVELLDARQFKGYSADGVKLKFLTWNSDSNRWYINPGCFAGLLGVMAVQNIDYLGFNGFSDNKAQSVGGSSSHRNGLKGDLRYLSTGKKGEATLLQDSDFDYEKQKQFNNSLYDFGWGILEDMYSEKFIKDKKEVLLPHTKHMKKLGVGGYRHHHHLHLSGFDASTIIIVNK